MLHPNPLDGPDRDVLDDWVADGRADASMPTTTATTTTPVPPIMDAVWSPIADAVMRPVFGDLHRRPQQHPRSRWTVRASPTSTRTFARCCTQPVQGQFNLQYCGSGSLDALPPSLWAAIDQAAAGLAAAQGRGSGGVAQHGASRLNFTPGLIPDTFRGTNRPTFQQVLEFLNPDPGHGNGHGGH